MKKPLLSLAALSLAAILAGAAATTTPAAPPATSQPAATTPEEDDDDEECAEGDVTAQEDEITDDSEQDIRENPVFDIEPGDDIDIPVPDFIRSSSNHVIFNGAKWDKLRRAFADSQKKPVSVVLIGDSHVQAGMNSGTTRELLQYDFGNAGRGIIAPLKMSGTNQPVDYVFTSSDSWSPVKLMSRQWSYPMGFTGTSLHPSRNSGSFTVGTKDTDDYNPFKSFTIFHGGKMTIDNIVNDRGEELHYKVIPSHDYTQVVMSTQENEVKVDFSSKGDLTLYGVALSGERPGVFYHSIGNNGATYNTYNRIGNVGAGIAPLSPSLVIIALGTNEAFGRFNATAFSQSIDRLVKNIQESNPDAAILLMTPMECQRSVSRKVTKTVKVPAGKRRRGKKGRRRRSSKTVSRKVTTTVRDYAPNRNIAEVRDEILRYGRENNIAVLDFWDVAGGSGASSRWIANGLFAKDRIHHTRKGYNLEGRLVYDALIDAIVNKQ